MRHRRQALVAKLGVATLNAFRHFSARLPPRGIKWALGTPMPNRDIWPVIVCDRLGRIRTFACHETVWTRP